MKIEFTSNPQSIDIDFLHQKINEEMVEHGAAHSFAFFIRGAKNEIIAGCNGFMFNGDFNSIYTDQLWVSPTNRNQGLARKLMAQVHEYGRSKGCGMATVCTMSFQNALKFYEKLGYTVDLERTDKLSRESCLFLRMDL